MELTPDTNVDTILEKIKDAYRHEKTDDCDGIKIDFAHSWVHLRKSNTEPIIRIYSEAQSEKDARDLATEIINKIQTLM